MHVSACRKKKILVEWWTWAHRHADGLRVHVMWISVKEKKDKKRLIRMQMSARKKKKQLTWDCGHGCVNALHVVVDVVMIGNRRDTNGWWM